MKVIQLLKWNQQAHEWLLFVTKGPFLLILKETCYFLQLAIKLTSWVLAVYETLHPVMLKVLLPHSHTLKLFVVTVWAWNNYLIFQTQSVHWCSTSDSSSPFSAGKALQNHLTHWSHYLPVHWRREGNFPKCHLIPWMFTP